MFVALLVVNVALGALFGALQLSVAQAGIAYGSRRWAFSPRRVLRAAAIYLIVVTVLLQAASGMLSLAVVFALIGVAVAPLLVVSTTLTETVVPSGALMQALTWLSSAGAAGVVTGSAAAGIGIPALGAAGGFLPATPVRPSNARRAGRRGHPTPPRSGDL